MDGNSLLHVMMAKQNLEARNTQSDILNQLVSHAHKKNDEHLIDLLAKLKAAMRTIERTAK